MNAQRKLLISGTAVLTVLLLSGCGEMYLGAGYTSPYIGDFGPYYPGYASYYGSDFIIGGTHYRNHAGWHHFYGQSFGSHHFSRGRLPGGGRPQVRPSRPGGGYPGGSHR